MKWFRLLLLVSLVAAPALHNASAAVQMGAPAPDFTAQDIHNATVQLSELKGNIVVLEWTNPGCPFVQKHYDSGNMQALQKEARGKGVVWISINSGAEGKQGYMSADDAVAYTKNAGSHASHYVLDSDGVIGHLYDAKTTPDMFVIDTAGRLAYMGAIDDRATVDKADIAGARNYVRDAINALLAGHQPEISNAKSYGCGVKY